MTAMIKYLIISLFLITTAAATAQGVRVSDTVKIPAGYKAAFNRELNHDLIDKEQKLILASDGNDDGLFTPSTDNDINFLLTKSLIKKVDALQYLIETDSLFEHRIKVKYLRGLEYVLRYFRETWKPVSKFKVNPVNLLPIITAYEDCMNRTRIEENPIDDILNQLSYDGGLNVMAATIFDKNPGLARAKQNLVLKYCLLNPDRILYILKDNPNMPFADSLIRTLDKKKFARELYDFAQGSNSISYVLRNIVDDTFIRTIVKMARSKSGQQYFSFLDNILSGKLTFEEIDSVKGDSLLYFRLLIKTQTEYVARTLNFDTAFEYQALRGRVKTKAESFVNIINGLHTETAEVRFKCIQPLTAEELYYLAVSTEGAMYTSSFVKGVYPLMMSKINNKGDSLLKVLYLDKYRKFIKMAAGFNMLSNFLSTFPPKKTPDEESVAEKLMRAFVGKLELGNDLEDGVDVADSYASVVETIKPIADEMLKNILDNYQRNEKDGNKRGMAIYKILTQLFLSADSANNIDLTKELGIPPVYKVPFKALANDSGRVVIQVFMYGDKDGMGVFPSIVGLFNNANWKTDRTNPQWVTISSLKGNPVSIYLNKPLPEEKNEIGRAHV